MIPAKVQRWYEEDSHHVTLTRAVSWLSHIIHYCTSKHPLHQTLLRICLQLRWVWAASLVTAGTGLGWYPRSHVSCQIHATRSIWDSRGKNYCPVATVTSHMQKTPCCGWKKWWFVRFDFEKPFQWWEGGREEGWCGSEGQKWKKESQIHSEEEGEKTRQGLTRRNWQQCFRQFGSLLSLYFYTESRNTSSAIHFISIPTPANHLHSVSFASPPCLLSFLRMPLHFLNDNILAISTLA